MKSVLFNFQIIQLSCSLVGNRGSGPAFLQIWWCSVYPVRCISTGFDSSSEFCAANTKLSSSFFPKTMALSPHISLVPQGIFYTIFICWLKLKIFLQEASSGCQAPLGYNIAGILSHSSFQLNPTSQHHQVSIVTASINVNFPISLPGQGNLELKFLLTHWRICSRNEASMFEDNESGNHLEDGLERMSLVARKTNWKTITALEMRANRRHKCKHCSGFRFHDRLAQNME